MKKINVLLTAVACSAMSLAHAAETTDDRFYLAPFGSFLNGGGDRNAKDGWGGGLGIGKAVNSYLNIEVEGFYQGLSHKSRPQLGDGTVLGSGGGGPIEGGPVFGAQSRYDLTGGTVDALLFPYRSTFSPYAVIGVGGMNTSFEGRSNAAFIGEAGAGFTYELLDNLLIRSDVRYRYVNDHDSLPKVNQFHDMVVNLGFVVPIGAKPQGEQVAALEPRVANLECANSDSDHDGVNDCDDKCPGTLAGSKVDAMGCPVRIELRGVNFKYDSADLTSGAKGILDSVSETLISFPQKRDIEVKGHTSSEGSSAYNLRLSQRRSASVVAYLKQKGVTNALHAKGYGEDYPVADNTTEEGRSKNRRVELVWLSD